MLNRFLPDDVPFWAYTLTVLAVGLTLRFLIFQYPLLEGDEYIYHTLVTQFLNGKGYTLQGSGLLEQPWISREMYDSPVFFHPPLGTYFFWLVQGVVGLDVAGLKAAQLVSYVIFYLSFLGIFRILFPRPSEALKYGFPLLLVLSPIFAHTSTKVWIDNPRLAFLCFHIFCCLLAAKRQGGGGLVLCALTSFLSTGTKVDALISLPFIYGFVWSLEENSEKRRFLLRFFGALFLANAAGVAGWLYYSEALKYGPGRPSAELIESNEFVRFATVIMGTRQYIQEFFKLFTTLVPSMLIILVCAFRNGFSQWPEKIRALGPKMFLFGWIFSQALVYMVLGMQGYSKLLRYFLLATPAVCLLFAYAVEDLRAHGKKNLLFAGLAILLFAAFQIELLHGIRTLVFATNDSMVYPVF